MGKWFLWRKRLSACFLYYGELIWCSFHSLTRRASCVRCLHTSHAVFGLEEFFPPGVIEKGELAPESVNTGICLYLRYPLSNFCCLPPSQPSLKSKDLLFVEQQQGCFAERRTLYAECRMPNDSKVSWLGLADWVNQVSGQSSRYYDSKWILIYSVS